MMAPDPLPTMGEVKKNNQLATGVGGEVSGGGGHGDGGGNCSGGGGGGKVGGGGKFGGKFGSKFGGKVGGEVGGDVAGNVAGGGGKGSGKGGGDGKSNKVDGVEGGGQAIGTRAMAMTWANSMAMRLAGNKKGKGGLQGQWQR
jgi:hypothetical protein